MPIQTVTRTAPDAKCPLGALKVTLDNNSTMYFCKANADKSVANVNESQQVAGASRGGGGGGHGGGGGGGHGGGGGGQGHGGGGGGRGFAVSHGERGVSVTHGRDGGGGGGIVSVPHRQLVSPPQFENRGPRFLGKFRRPESENRYPFYVTVPYPTYPSYQPTYQTDQQCPVNCVQQPDRATCEACIWNQTGGNQYLTTACCSNKPNIV